jgi:hypothetical protein
VAVANCPTSSLQCDAGKASASPAATSCTPCPSGTYAVAAGAAACSECIGGSFSGEEGRTSAAACQLCEAGKVSNGPGAAECEACEGEESSESYCITGGGIATSGVRAAVDAAAAGAVTLWEAGTGVLAQTWAVSGWGYGSGEFFSGKAGTLQCTDVVAKCTIDAQATSSDARSVLYVEDANGVYLTGLIVRGGYRSSVSRGVAGAFKRHPDACTKFACAALPTPTPPKTPTPSHP